MNTNSGKHILAIDQGTTSTRAIVFDLDFNPRATAQIELQQHYPQPGWVEHDAEEIWSATLKVCRDAIAQVGGAANIAAIGITNQRETTIVWDRKTGAPVHRAIVWQDRRTSEVCAAHCARRAMRSACRKLTGLLLDPYFSGTKIAWILDRDPSVAQTCGGGRTRLRHGGIVPGVASHARPHARLRHHQRLAHARVRHQHPRLERRDVRVAQSAPRAAAGGPRLRCTFRRC